MSILDPQAVDAALRQVVAHADYDLLKSLEGDESGVDEFPQYAMRFIAEYEKQTGSESARDQLVEAIFGAITFNAPVDGFGGQDKRLNEYAVIWANAAATAVLALRNKS